jgi:hypothetical protein
MKRSIVIVGGVMLTVFGLVAITLTGCSKSTAAPTIADSAKMRPQPTSPSDHNEGSGKGMAAIRAAAAANKYLFVFFSKADDEQTRAMRVVFDGTMKKASDRAQWAALNVTDSQEKDIVVKFDLSRAPMPLVLAIAPNGAVTGGFPSRFTETQLLDAFASPVLQQVMKHLQNRRLVFVCVHNDKTKSNDLAMQGVNEFKADERFASATEIVMLDPADPSEASFLADMKIDPKTEEAMTIFMAPPGAVVAEYKGATDKTELADTLQKASSGCCPGGSCGPGGCGSK